MALPAISRFQNRVALVTGASVGIGAAVCDTLVRHGLIVVGCARNNAPIDEHAKRLQEEGVTGKLHSYKCDVGKEDEIEQMFQWIEKTLGGVDVCVNNAGVAVSETLLDSNPAHIRDMLNVNVIGLIMCTKLTIKSLQKRSLDDGHILQINSMLGHKIRGVRNCYAASKFAVSAITEGFRQELTQIGSRIRVTSISPGMVKTHFHYAHYGVEKAEELYATIPVLQAQDVANAVVNALSQPAGVLVHDFLLEAVGVPSSLQSLNDAYKK